MKKILSFILTICIVFCSFPISSAVFAEGESPRLYVGVCSSEIISNVRVFSLTDQTNKFDSLNFSFNNQAVLNFYFDDGNGNISLLTGGALSIPEGLNLSYFSNEQISGDADVYAFPCITFEHVGNYSISYEYSNNIYSVNLIANIPVAAPYSTPYISETAILKSFDLYNPGDSFYFIFKNDFTNTSCTAVVDNSTWSDFTIEEISTADSASESQSVYRITFNSIPSENSLMFKFTIKGNAKNNLNDQINGTYWFEVNNKQEKLRYACWDYENNKLNTSGYYSDVLSDIPGNNFDFAFSLREDGSGLISESNITTQPAFVPDQGTNQNAVVITASEKTAFSPIYNIQFIDLGSGTIVIGYDGTEYSIPVYSSLPDVGFYSSEFAALSTYIRGIEHTSNPYSFYLINRSSRTTISSVSIDNANDYDIDIVSLCTNVYKFTITDYHGMENQSQHFDIVYTLEQPDGSSMIRNTSIFVRHTEPAKPKDYDDGIFFIDIPEYLEEEITFTVTRNAVTTQASYEVSFNVSDIVQSDLSNWYNDEVINDYLGIHYGFYTSAGGADKVFDLSGNGNADYLMEELSADYDSVQMNLHNAGSSTTCFLPIFSVNEKDYKVVFSKAHFENHFFGAAGYNTSVPEMVYKYNVYSFLNYDDSVVKYELPCCVNKVSESRIIWNDNITSGMGVYNHENGVYDYNCLGGSVISSDYLVNEGNYCFWQPVTINAPEDYYLVYCENTGSYGMSRGYMYSEAVSAYTPMFYTPDSTTNLVGINPVTLKWQNSSGDIYTEVIEFNFYNGHSAFESNWSALSDDAIALTTDLEDSCIDFTYYPDTGYFSVTFEECMVPSVEAMNAQIVFRAPAGAVYYRFNQNSGASSFNQEIADRTDSLINTNEYITISGLGEVYYNIIELGSYNLNGINAFYNASHELRGMVVEWYDAGYNKIGGQFVYGRAEDFTCETVTDSITDISQVTGLVTSPVMVVSEGEYTMHVSRFPQDGRNSDIEKFFMFDVEELDTGFERDVYLPYSYFGLSGYGETEDLPRPVIKHYENDLSLSETIQGEYTQYGVKFTVSSFSPFTVGIEEETGSGEEFYYISYYYDGQDVCQNDYINCFRHGLSFGNEFFVDLYLGDDDQKTKIENIVSVSPADLSMCEADITDFNGTSCIRIFGKKTGNTSITVNTADNSYVIPFCITTHMGSLFYTSEVALESLVQWDFSTEKADITDGTITLYYVYENGLSSSDIDNYTFGLNIEESPAFITATALEDGNGTYYVKLEIPYVVSAYYDFFAIKEGSTNQLSFNTNIYGESYTINVDGTDYIVGFGFEEAGGDIVTVNKGGMSGWTEGGSRIFADSDYYSQYRSFSIFAGKRTSDESEAEVWEVVKNENKIKLVTERMWIENISGDDDVIMLMNSEGGYVKELNSPDDFSVLKPAGYVQSTSTDALGYQKTNSYGQVRVCAQVSAYEVSEEQETLIHSGTVSILADIRNNFTVNLERPEIDTIEELESFISTAVISYAGADVNIKIHLAPGTYSGNLNVPDLSDIPGNIELFLLGADSRDDKVTVFNGTINGNFNSFVIEDIVFVANENVLTDGKTVGVHSGDVQLYNCSFFNYDIAVYGNDCTMNPNSTMFIGNEVAVLINITQNNGGTRNTWEHNYFVANGTAFKLLGFNNFYSPYYLRNYDSSFIDNDIDYQVSCPATIYHYRNFYGTSKYSDESETDYAAFTAMTNADKAAYLEFLYSLDETTVSMNFESRSPVVEKLVSDVNVITNPRMKYPVADLWNTILAPSDIYIDESRNQNTPIITTGVPGAAEALLQLGDNQMGDGPSGSGDGYSYSNPLVIDWTQDTIIFNSMAGSLLIPLSELGNAAGKQIKVIDENEELIGIWIFDPEFEVGAASGYFDASIQTEAFDNGEEHRIDISVVSDSITEGISLSIPCDFSSAHIVSFLDPDAPEEYRCSLSDNMATFSLNGAASYSVAEGSIGGSVKLVHGFVATSGNGEETLYEDGARLGKGCTYSAVIGISENTGFCNLSLQLEYDVQLLELVSIEKEDYVNSVYACLTSPGLIALTLNSADPDSYEGIISYIEFKVKDDAEITGSESVLTLTSLKMNVDGVLYDENDINLDQDDIPLNLEFCVPVPYTVISTVCGDANGDGKVDIKDVQWLMSYMLGDSSKTYFRDAMDVNNDSRINAKDVLSVLRYTAQHDVILF